MEDPAGTESAQDSIRHENILKLQNSYFREWIDTLPAGNEKELFVRQEIQKLVDYDVDMHLHVGTTTLLDTIHAMHVANEVKDSGNASDLFRNRTESGMNSMCCVMNTMRYIAFSHYKFELKRYLSSISFLYTIKLNLLDTMEPKRNKFDDGIDRFVQPAIWEYDFRATLPRVDGSGISRTRFVLSSVEIFNCIVSHLGLPPETHLHPSTKISVKRQVPASPQHRFAYIVAWIVFGMLSNNFDKKIC